MQDIDMYLGMCVHLSHPTCTCTTLNLDLVAHWTLVAVFSGRNERVLLTSQVLKKIHGNPIRPIIFRDVVKNCMNGLSTTAWTMVFGILLLTLALALQALAYFRNMKRLMHRPASEVYNHYWSWYSIP